MAIFPGSAITPAAAGGYTIDQSLRFEDGSSAYLSRTPASAGNRKTWTWSGWVKRGNIGTNQSIIRANGSGDTGRTDIWFDTNDVLTVAGSSTYFRITDQKFRDVSAWYHLVFQFDTTQATADDRLKIYVNGVQITIFSTNNAYTQNTDYGINATVSHTIGSGYGYLDGYLSEVHFIDGQALTPASFGEVDETYGHWKPIEYTGTYGTNGFYLPFSGTFYNDASGNGNNWTANNLATTDVVLDSPTNNFAVLNVLNKFPTATASEGNLKIYHGPNDVGEACTPSTMAAKTKVYWEVVYIGGSDNGHGISLQPAPANAINGTYNESEEAVWIRNGYVYIEGTSLGNSFGGFSNGDILQGAFDPATKKIWFGKNNTWLNSGDPANGTGNLGTMTKYDEYLASMGTCHNGGTAVINFGQDSSFAGNKTAQNNTDANGYGDFYYSPPSGFLALCTANLPEPAVVPGENFNTVLYTGNGSTQSITGVGFQPDFTWIKSRSDTWNHALFDAIRGTTKYLESNTTASEFTNANSLTAFNTDGFSIGNASIVNSTTNAIVAWNWKADNTSGSSNTDGSITSTVSANPDAGFSIAAFDPPSSGTFTFGHGLGVTPDFIILKERDGGGNAWTVWHKYYGSPTNNGLYLASTSGTFASGQNWLTGTTSSTIGIRQGEVTGGDYNWIVYSFAEVDGFSKFGSYTGNGSTDGTFVYTGFRPAFVMIKQSSASGESWVIHDNKRTISNVDDDAIFPNVSNAETSAASYSVDVLSNGFKLRNSHAVQNSSGATYIFMAFAEYPFSKSNAR